MASVQPTTNGERLDFVFLNLVGENVTVDTVDGARIEGILASRDDDDQTPGAAMSVVLSCARFRPSRLHKCTDELPMYKMLRVAAADVVMLTSTPVAFRSDNPARGRVEHLHGAPPMMTNPPIKWSEAEEEELEGELDDGNHREGSWDQFDANARKFNVKSTYDENLYTTKLDRSKFTAEQIAAADRKAAEINNTQARGIQHRIERGEDVDVDEGELYSDVMRPGQNLPGARGPAASAQPAGGSGAKLPPPKPGAYVPPARKQAQQASTAPAPVEDVTSRAEAMATTQPANRTQQLPPGGARGTDSGAPPSPIAETVTTPAAPQQQGGGAPPKQGLNVGAKEFVPGFVPGGAAPQVPELLPSANVNEYQLPPRVVTDMVRELAVAMNAKINQKFCPPDWPGDDLFYDEEENYDGAAGGRPGELGGLPYGGHAPHVAAAPTVHVGGLPPHAQHGGMHHHHAAHHHHHQHLMAHSGHHHQHHAAHHHAAHHAVHHQAHHAHMHAQHHHHAVHHHAHAQNHAVAHHHHHAAHAQMHVPQHPHHSVSHVHHHHHHHAHAHAHAHAHSHHAVHHHHAHAQMHIPPSPHHPHSGHQQVPPHSHGALQHQAPPHHQAHHAAPPQHSGYPGGGPSYPQYPHSPSSPTAHHHHAAHHHHVAHGGHHQQHHHAAHHHHHAAHHHHAHAHMQAPMHHHAVQQQQQHPSVPSHYGHHHAHAQYGGPAPGAGGYGGGPSQGGRHPASNSPLPHQQPLHADPNAGAYGPGPQQVPQQQPPPQQGMQSQQGSVAPASRQMSRGGGPRTQQPQQPQPQSQPQQPQPQQSMPAGPPSPVDPGAPSAPAAGTAHRQMGRGRGVGSMGGAGAPRMEEPPQPSGPPGSSVAPGNRGKRGGAK